MKVQKQRNYNFVHVCIFMGYMLCFNGLQTVVPKEHLYSCTKVFLLVAFFTGNLQHLDLEQPSCQD